MPALSQPLLRAGLLIAAVTIWIAWTVAMTSRDDVRTPAPDGEARPEPATARDAILFAAGVPFGRWLRFAVPGALLVSIVGFIGVVLAA